MADYITDPALLSELNGGKKYIEDPAILQKLNSESSGSTKAASKKALDDKVSAAYAKSNSELPQDIANSVAGFVRGAGSIGATLLAPLDITYDLLRGKGALESNNKRREDMDRALAQLGADKNSLAYSGFKTGAEVAGTSGVGGALGNGVRAISQSPRAVAFANALGSGGFRAGNTPGFKNLLTRIAGGAGTGFASNALVDPESAGTGAVVGGAIPFGGALIGGTARLGNSLVRPFFNRGQDNILKKSFQELADNPNSLAREIPEIIPGSTPTTVMASGDTGLAGVSRSMQTINPKYNSDLVAKQASQNAARTSAIEDYAGNTGKLDLAKKARDESTGSMREDVLSRAGGVSSEPVLKSIDKLLSKPDNAGKISQQALSEVRNRIANFSSNGAIDAKALYAIRKDINDSLSGKLQGEAGNLRYASGQLINAKEVIDDAIDKASRLVKQSSSREVGPVGSSVGTITSQSNKGPVPTWKEYLQEYSKQSKPIEQMELLDDLLKRIQTGTVDKGGNAVLSAAKLNNILKNETPDLTKKLSPEQLTLLRNISADLNASQLAMNAGKSVGSDTVQKLGTNSILLNTLGKKIGGSSPAVNMLGRVLELPYGSANKQIMEKMGNALLDQKEFIRIMNTPEGNALLKNILDRTAPALSRAAPVAISQ